MVFSGLSFLYVFLPAVLLLYWLAPKRLKNAVLLLFSLAFYYVGEQERVLLMVASCLADYLCALMIDTHREKKWVRSLFLGLSLAFNLGLLACFKYADLLIGGINALTGAGLPLLGIALPIGISFYTFQTMSYTIDVYRGEKACRNLPDFACYVTMFPQLIAGPIVRYSDVAKELKAVDRRVTPESLEESIRRFCFGLGKKVLLANNLAELVTLAESRSTPTVLLAWVAALASPLQIYFDFSGYSDMAIGLGGLLGFHYPENFRFPFVSRSVSEFWRRWHMTLGSWFKDYLYIPLGGSRVKKPRLLLNLLIVWSVTGLWHGAAVNYILWGAFYGAMIILERLFLLKWLEKKCVPASVLSRLYLFLVTVAGFQIFNSSSVADTGTRICRLFGAGGIALCSVTARYYSLSYLPLLLMSFVLAMPWLPEGFAKWSAKSRRAENALRIAGDLLSLLLLLLSTAYLVDGSYNPFLYFRF